MNCQAFFIIIFNLFFRLVSGFNGYFYPINRDGGVAGCSQSDCYVNQIVIMNNPAILQCVMNGFITIAYISAAGYVRLDNDLARHIEGVPFRRVTGGA